MSLPEFVFHKGDHVGFVSQANDGGWWAINLNRTGRTLTTSRRKAVRLVRRNRKKES